MITQALFFFFGVGLGCVAIVLSQYCAHCIEKVRYLRLRQLLFARLGLLALFGAAMLGVLFCLGALFYL
jgi:hypothetical protein